MSDFVFCSGFLVVGGFMDRAGVLVFQFGVLLDCVFTSYWWLPPPCGWPWSMYMCLCAVVGSFSVTYRITEASRL